MVSSFAAVAPWHIAFLGHINGITKLILLDDSILVFSEVRLCESVLRHNRRPKMSLLFLYFFDLVLTSRRCNVALLLQQWHLPLQAQHHAFQLGIY